VRQYFRAQKWVLLQGEIGGTVSVFSKCQGPLARRRLSAPVPANENGGTLLVRVPPPDALELDEPPELETLPPPEECEEEPPKEPPDEPEPEE
jgi:hypothetical protein